MGQPLNPALYRRLKRHFGTVKIANEGQAFVATPVRSLANGPRLDIAQDGEYYRVSCFAAETLVATPQGDMPIKDLVGIATLLVPNAKGLGNWRAASVRSFGKQPLLTVHMRRGSAKKTIRATPAHRWVMSGRKGIYHVKRTEQLQRGDRFASCFTRSIASYAPRCPNVSVIGVAQGFTFGDGSHESRRTPGAVRFYALKDAALFPYFRSCRFTTLSSHGKKIRQACDLPISWNTLPSHTESLAFLLGWFAGYFAADGHVAKNGKQATLYSSKKENLQFAKGICYQLGIRVSAISPKKRSAEGCVRGSSKKKMYSMSFYVVDVPNSFWIQAHHRRRVISWKKKDGRRLKLHWIVDYVEDRGEKEEVFCAVVPGVEKFVLAENLLTMNCPYCSDTRHRLYVSYMFGKPDVFKRRMTFLVFCFNENCMCRQENQEDFVDTLEDSGEWLDKLPVSAGEVLPEEARTVMLPGPCKPLSVLAPNHPARQYLQFDRSFDPDIIAEKYGVEYCSGSHYFLARNRIIIPVYEGEELKGWQARHIGELPWKDKEKRRDLPPKYFSCPNSQFRSRCIYNWDRMKQWRTGVIVEGPMDVWRFGYMSGCIFGNSMTPAQKSKVHTVFSDSRRTLILLLDPEEFHKDATQQLITWWESRLPKRFCAVKLPEGTDPGSLDRSFLRGYVARKAKKHGVKVYYEKVA